MIPKIGNRLYSVACAAEVIVVRASAADVDVRCGDVSMVLQAPDNRDLSAAADGALLGKRYEDETSGLELLVTKGGAGVLSVDGRVLAQKEAKRLPASD